MHLLGCFYFFWANLIHSIFPGDLPALKHACLVLSKTIKSLPTLIDKFQIVEVVQVSYSVDLTATNFKGAVILHLDIPVSKKVGGASEYPSVFTIAHSSSILTALATLRDGYIRPPAAAEYQAQWCQFLVSIQWGAMSNSDRKEGTNRSL